MQWLQELSIPDIYRLVLTELFTLMPGPRVLLETFQQSIPSGTKLICAQVVALTDRSVDQSMSCVFVCLIGQSVGCLVAWSINRLLPFGQSVALACFFN